MKKSTLMLLAALCLITISIHAAETVPVTAEVAPQTVAADDPPLPEAGSEVTEPATPALFEDPSIFFAGPRPSPNMCQAITCDDWDNSYCDYQCGGYECCTGTVLISGSYCPKICA